MFSLKVLGFVLVLFASAKAGDYLVKGGGTSVETRHQDDWGNYGFKYEVVDPYGATKGRWETGDAYGHKKGSYSILDVDGRVRHVDYVADEQGFRAVIKSNEPGTQKTAPVHVHHPHYHHEVHHVNHAVVKTAAVPVVKHVAAHSAVVPAVVKHYAAPVKHVVPAVVEPVAHAHVDHVSKYVVHPHLDHHYHHAHFHH